MSKIKIEDEYEINDELVFCYPNAEVGMIHSHVLDVRKTRLRRTSKNECFRCPRNAVRADI